jgi:hypothetical protein
LSARHTEAARVLSSRGQQRMAGAGFYTLLREQAKPKLPGCPSLSGRSGQTRTPMRCKQHWQWEHRVHKTQSAAHVDACQARQGKARQGKARQGKARQGKARQGKAAPEGV